MSTLANAIGSGCATPEEMAHSRALGALAALRAALAEQTDALRGETERIAGAVDRVVGGDAA